MEKDIEELKEKLNNFVNKYNISNINIYLNENLNGHKTITLQIEV